MVIGQNEIGSIPKIFVLCVVKLSLPKIDCALNIKNPFLLALNTIKKSRIFQLPVLFMKVFSWFLGKEKKIMKKKIPGRLLFCICYSNINTYHFSGENLDGKLTIERFLAFQEQLQREILSLEFSRKPAIDSLGNRISEKDFADLLLTYADYTPKKRSTVFKRVKKKYPPKRETPGVTLEDYIDIFSVLIHIDDVDKVSSIFCFIK